MSRPLSTHLRQSSIGPGFTALGSSTGGISQPTLVSRINEKKIELENLKQLRDLSAGLAKQLKDLEDKLGVLTDGTEAVAIVLANWHNVLRAISIAAARIPAPKEEVAVDGNQDEKSATEGQGSGSNMQREQKELEYPQLLVRIPTRLDESLDAEYQQQQESRRDEMEVEA